MFIRKFYDVDAPEAPAVSGPINIAAIMAKQGVLSTPERPAEVPKINTTEKKEETAPASQAAPANANEPKPAAKADPSSPSPSKEPTTASPQTAAPATAQTWQEVLRSQQPDTIFKELGLDEEVVNLSKKIKDNPKMAGFFKHWETTNGDYKPYLEALSTDFSKMPPEEVMKRQLQKKYPELDTKQLDTLYKIKVTHRYKLDDVLYSEEEVADGRVELMADVKPIRAALAAEQENYLLPKPPEPQAAGPDLAAQKVQQDYEAYKSGILDSPQMKNIIATKQMVFGDGDEAYKHPVDPNRISQILLEPDAWAEAFFNPDKTPDVETQTLIGAILADKSLIKKMQAHFKSIGGKAFSDQLDNASKPAAGAAAHAEVETTDPAAAAAKRGRLVPGGQ